MEYLYFALGKCYDDIGEWAKAFEYFTLGCRLKRQRITYNSAEQIQFTHQLINCFTQQSIKNLQAFANPSALPVFIVGMPRSGSTLVEQIFPPIRLSHISHNDVPCFVRGLHGSRSVARSLDSASKSRNVGMRFCVTTG